MGFSQRRLIGYRNKYEFDQKRILLSSLSEVKIVGYSNNHETIQEVAVFKLDEGLDQEIKFCQFADEFQPDLVLMITYSPRKNKTYL